ncbi:hypothetical protein H2203_001831 [Taxawa tesnikishii (nom. ined.)]|nr:hypothetical protein H2203_001831 [Dothideales sp. JES 119]
MLFRKQLVSLSSGCLLLALYSTDVSAASAGDYSSHATQAADVMNKNWYNESTGLWENMWWNSANVLTVLGDLALVNQQYADAAEKIFNNTLQKAPGKAAGAKGFLNAFYDDEGWWALAFIKGYDFTKDPRYLSQAETIFDDMTTGWNATCGGHWWNKPGDAQNPQANTAIGNSLFLSAAASLANRVPSKKSEYLGWAQKEWEWFSGSGLINSDNLINDGIDLKTCKNNGATTFTYNQGVILGGLVELNMAAPDPSYLPTASKIAHATIAKLVDDDGILTEPNEKQPMDPTSAQFKGVFARNLHYLQEHAPDDAYVTFLQKNADAIWAKDQNDGELGTAWQGPYYDAEPAGQSSALDCLVAAAAVS